MTTTKLTTLETVQTYLDAWNETDPERRADLLARTVTDDVLFADPMHTSQGRRALHAWIADVHTQFPGITFEPSGEPDEHNGFVRAAWVAVGPDGPVLSGIDVDDIGADGRISRVIGFFNKE